MNLLRLVSDPFFFFYVKQFDLWTDSQRKRFLDVIFRQCTRSQNRFVIEWFRQHVPMQHLDFTTILPRFLSLYVFSFLEPKSLCRAAQTCWHWRFLADQVQNMSEYQAKQWVSCVYSTVSVLNSECIQQ